MTKSRDSTIDLAECLKVVLLKDILSVYPEDQLDLARDSKRVTQQSRTRGLSFFTIDLPAIGKRFDASLSSERLDLNSLAHTAPGKRGSQIPRLFQGLWLRVFHDNGCLRRDADVQAVYFLRTLFYMFKKVTPPDNPEGLPCSPRYVYSTVKEFMDVEQSLPPAEEIWNGDHLEFTRTNCGHVYDLGSTGPLDVRPDHNSLDGRESALFASIQHVADRVSSSFGFLPNLDLKPKHGPGAVSDWPLSKYKYDFEKWSPYLERLFPYDHYGTHSIESDMFNSVPTGKLLYEEGASKLFAVPKDQKGPRLIAAEPLANQWMQQGVANWLREQTSNTILSSCINFFDQEPSRVGALKASLDGKNATIDLKSASDRLTCALVQRLFRANITLLDAFRACRTRFLVNPIDSKSSSLVRLRKYATQGSALTFPLQSIAFSMICLGVGKFFYPRRSLRWIAGKVRVFGDDIIVPVEWVDDIIRVFTRMHLRVNMTKTHRNGYFRESCGMDAFRGVDVTPPYLHILRYKALNTRDLASTLAVTNNLFLKGFWHTSVWMSETVHGINKFIPVPPSSRVPGLISFSTKGTFHDYDTVLTDTSHQRHLLSFVPGDGVRTIPPNGEGSRVHRVPLSGRKVVRWNGNLQRKEIRLLVLHGNEQNRNRSFTGGSEPLLEGFLRTRDTTAAKTAWFLGGPDSPREALERAFEILYPIQVSRLGRITSRSPTRGAALNSAPLVRSGWVPLEDLNFLSGSR
jgi:hypothetical protein